MAKVFRLEDKVVCVIDEKEAELLRAILGRLKRGGSGPDRAWKSRSLFEGLVAVDVERTLWFDNEYNAKEIKTT